jgi:hypothetical protein
MCSERVPASPPCRPGKGPRAAAQVAPRDGSRPQQWPGTPEATCRFGPASGVPAETRWSHKVYWWPQPTAPGHRWRQVGPRSPASCPTEPGRRPRAQLPRAESGTAPAGAVTRAFSPSDRGSRGTRSWCSQGRTRAGAGTARGSGAAWRCPHTRGSRALCHVAGRPLPRRPRYGPRSPRGRSGSGTPASPPGSHARGRRRREQPRPGAPGPSGRPLSLPVRR